jgi:predicted nucleic acid-binding protein
LDANILLCASSAAPADAVKRERAQALMLEELFALSAQALEESIANALRKKALGLTEANINAALELASQVPVQPITRELVVEANALRRRYNLSQWDATILAAARALGCQTLCSDDLNHGQDYDGVRVVNPFV